MSPLSRHPALVCLAIACLFLPLGCGSLRIPVPITPDGSISILQSPELATGAWTFLGGDRYIYQNFLYPIGGFYGALTASGTSVQGIFNIAQGDPGNPQKLAPCLTQQDIAGTGLLTVAVTGTASNGTLTLDGSFGANQLHLTAQLSPSRTSVTSGSYTVTGPCATSAPGMSGYYSPPLTGTYKVTINSTSGVPTQITAQLTQGASYDRRGYIPLSGTLTFTTPGCTVSLAPDNNQVVGSTSGMFGTIGPSASRNFVGFDADELDPLSLHLTLDDWFYTDPICGSAQSDPHSPGVLVRQ